jgi:DNA-binding NtrC family response regulator
MKKILIIEDDINLGQMLSLHFEDEGFRPQHVPSCEKARDAVQHSFYDLILLDQQLPDGNGIDLLPELITQNSERPVIMMTGHHDLELAITAIKNGAADFIHKPVKTADLQTTVNKAMRAYENNSSTVSLSDALPDLNISKELVGKSSAMLAVSKEIALSAQSSASILITGESGTGKELIAKLVHQHSNRSDQPFIAINCAAIVDNLLESELFGHEKGAFSGAVEKKPGKFVLAENGTLFLDEIGELALPLQAKLLRTLQEQTVEPVGSTHSIKINVRVIAATNRDLYQMARENAFREDLIYRLNVINIQIPPLRKRKEDIPLLAQALLEKSASELGKPTPKLSPEFLDYLHRQEWPGNVRELGNTITHALLHCRSQTLTPDVLEQPDNLEQSSATGSLEPLLLTLEEVEANHIQRVLKHTGGHKTNSCRILGISRPALDRKIEKYGLSLS